MAYDRKHGEHQARVLYRHLRQDERFTTTAVALLARIPEAQLADWCLNRVPVPQWATGRLVMAMERLSEGAGVGYLLEALGLTGEVVAMPAPRARELCPTSHALAMIHAAEKFGQEARLRLVDEGSPGRLDHDEVRDLEPLRRELQRTLAAYGAAAVHVERSQTRLALVPCK